MRIKELAPEPIPSTDFELANQEPSQEDLDTVQDFVDIIEHLRPAEALTRLQQLQREFPTLDHILDLIPQTRLVKNIALAVDSLIAQRPQDALNHLGRAVGGAVGTMATVANVGSSLKAGDYVGAAKQTLAATPVGQTVNKGFQLGKRAGIAGQALMDPATAYTTMKNRLLPQQEPAPVDNKTDELERLRRLSGI